MKNGVQPIPEGCQTITAYLCVRGATEAIEWYKKAFGAKEIYRLTGLDGQGIVHAEIQIGDSRVYIGEECVERGASSPATLGGSGVGIHLYVEDADVAFDRAVAAGATPELPVTLMFWGDRFGKLVDPFGHRWSVATHVEDVAPAEMQRRMAAMMAPAS